MSELVHAECFEVEGVLFVAHAYERAYLAEHRDRTLLVWYQPLSADWSGAYDVPTGGGCSMFSVYVHAHTTPQQAAAALLRKLEEENG